jgi:hypothetical protein
MWLLLLVLLLAVLLLLMLFLLVLLTIMVLMSLVLGGGVVIGDVDVNVDGGCVAGANTTNVLRVPWPSRTDCARLSSWKSFTNC